RCERLGGGVHQRLDRVRSLFRGTLSEPSPGTVYPLAVLQPGEGRPAKVRCRRGEREDGVGGGIEGGTMPLVDPVVAVYARITQVLDDFLLDQMLAGKGWHNLKHLEHVGVGADRGIALEREGEKEAHALERPEWPRRDRVTVAMQHAQRQRGVVGIRAKTLPGYPHPIVGERLAE